MVWRKGALLQTHPPSRRFCGSHLRVPDAQSGPGELEKIARMATRIFQGPDLNLQGPLNSSQIN